MPTSNFPPTSISSPDLTGINSDLNRQWSPSWPLNIPALKQVDNPLMTHYRHDLSMITFVFWFCELLGSDFVVGERKESPTRFYETVCLGVQKFDPARWALEWEDWFWVEREREREKKDRYNFHRNGLMTASLWKDISDTENYMGKEVQMSVNGPVTFMVHWGQKCQDTKCAWLHKKLTWH